MTANVAGEAARIRRRQLRLWMVTVGCHRVHDTRMIIRRDQRSLIP